MRTRARRHCATKSTYVDLDWNFADSWRWDAEAGLPVIKYVLPTELPNRVTTTFYGDPTTGRAFTWYQPIDTDAGAVMVSTDPTFPRDATQLVEATTEESEDGELLFRAIATDLAPGNTYYYRVGDSFSEIWSPTGRFITPDGDGDFTFINLTDTQSKAEAEAILSASTMAKSLDTIPEAEFMVHGGDVVQDGQIEQDWTDLFGAAQPTLLDTTIAPVSGNHDMATNRFVDHFTLEHPNEQDVATGAYYSYDYNGAHFMMLNTNEGGDAGISDAQLEWLAEDAAAARERGADWLLLTMHKGPYTPANHSSDVDIKALRERVVPLIDELDIDLVMQGHDHYFARTKVLASDPDGVENARVVETEKITEIIGGNRIEYNVDPDGTIYVLPNTAGAKHYNQATTADGFDLESYLELFDRLGSPRYGTGESFMSVEVTDDRLTINQYEIRNGGKPILAEGFGIDRELSVVDEQLAALPAAADVKLDDEPVIVAARAAVKELSRAQHDALSNLDRLLAAERALRILRGTLIDDGSRGGLGRSGGDVATGDHRAQHQASAVRRRARPAGDPRDSGRGADRAVPDHGRERAAVVRGRVVAARWDLHRVGQAAADPEAVGGGPVGLLRRWCGRQRPHRCVERRLRAGRALLHRHRQWRVSDRLDRQRERDARGRRPGSRAHRRTARWRPGSRAPGCSTPATSAVSTASSR